MDCRYGVVAVVCVGVGLMACCHFTRQLPSNMTVVRLGRTTIGQYPEGNRLPDNIKGYIPRDPPEVSRRPNCTLFVMHWLNRIKCIPGVARVGRDGKTRLKKRCTPNRENLKWDAPLDWFMRSLVIPLPAEVVCAHGHERRVVVEVGVAMGQFTRLFTEAYGIRKGCRNTTFFLVEADVLNPLHVPEQQRMMREFREKGEQAQLIYSFASNVSGVREAYCYSHCENRTSAPQLNVTTLDGALRRAQLHDAVIAFLKIDAEGEDVRILFGAQEALRRTEVVVFEQEPRRGNFDLYTAAELLQEAGFDLFFIGIGVFVRVSPEYLSTSFATMLPLGNVVAIRPGHPLHKAVVSRVVCS
eukprot:Hpha_TRINITY_DN5041_c0_g1::TRINITY_DN5041_c0_g1_i1::g.94122::m.94122